MKNNTINKAIETMANLCGVNSTEFISTSIVTTYQSNMKNELPEWHNIIIRSDREPSINQIISRIEIIVKGLQNEFDKKEIENFELYHNIDFYFFVSFVYMLCLEEEKSINDNVNIQATARIMKIVINSKCCCSN